jgi:hypothetical protein
LILEHEKLVSKFAFNFYLRRYIMVDAKFKHMNIASAPAPAATAPGEKAAPVVHKADAAFDDSDEDDAW